MNTSRVNGVSVIVPTYNGEKFIKNAISSILSQFHFFELEIVVVDDGSTDKTLSIIEAFNDARINIIQTKINVGTAAARNIGVAAAQFDWVGFNDQDDVWLQDKLEKQIKILDDYPELAGVGGGYARLDKNGRSRWFGKIFKKTWSPEHLLSLKNPPYYNPDTDGTCYIQTLLIHKSVLNKIGGFREKLPIAYDPDIIYRIGEVAKLGAVNEPVFLYRLWNDSITSPSRMQAINFLSGFAYCYASKEARYRGEQEPNMQDFLARYQPSDQEVATFKINQALRLINTQWVERGLWSAAFYTAWVFVKNPLSFLNYFKTKKLIRH